MPIYVLGADLARAGEDSSVFMIIEKGTPHKLVFIKEMKKNTMDQAIDYIKYLHKRFKFIKIICDQTGLGAGVADVLARDLNPPKTLRQDTYKTPMDSVDIVIGVTFTQKNKMDIFSNLKVLMEQGKLVIPNNKKLIYQLKDFRYETTESGNLKLHHSEGGRDDYCDALACAAHGLRSKQVGWFFG